MQDSTKVQTKKILMIEDDDMMRILFRDTFWIHDSSTRSVEVETVRSVAEGRTYLEESGVHPDIIFIGLRLLVPHPDGSSTREMEPTLELITDLRQDAAYTSTCIVVYSRFDEPELKERARAAGANHYIVKGELTPREIVDFVEHL